MQIGKVVGKVVSTAKHPTLVGIKLNLVRIPYDDPNGKILIAADAIRVSDTGDVVYLVDSTEGASAFRRGKIPVDLAIVGLVDKFYEG
ncbi:MAG: ethanolamine utilization protein EutN [Blautia sp.]|nr:ethanolamine utilization protein EutN [Blautia sp.]MDY5030352.1 EutN/CcmL family microcompartment protein [Blautia sp.]